METKNDQNNAFSGINDTKFMNIEVLNCKYLIFITFLYIFLAFFTIFFSFLSPKRIKVQKETIKTYQITTENPNPFSFYILNLNYFNDFYLASIKAFSNRNISLNYSVEFIKNGKSRLVYESKLFEVFSTMFKYKNKSSKSQLLHSSFLDGSDSVKLNLDIENTIEPIELSVIAETHSSKSQKLHLMIKALVSVFVFIIYFDFSNKVGNSGFICPEQFITQFFLLLTGILSFPIDIFRYVFPLTMIRTLNAFFSVVLICLILIVEFYLLYNTFIINEATKRIISTVFITSLSVYGIFTIVWDTIFYVFINQPEKETNMSTYLLIFVIGSLLFVAFVCNKYKYNEKAMQSTAYCLMTITTNACILIVQIFTIMERHQTYLDLSFQMNEMLTFLFSLLLCILHYPLFAKQKSSHKHRTRNSFQKQI